MRARLWSGVLPNPKPGIDDEVVPAHAEPQGALEGSLQVGDELGQEGRVARLGAVVHDHERDAVVGGQAGQRVVVADTPDVVDEVRAGGERRLGDGRLGRVDAERHRRKRRPERRDDRHDATSLLVRGDRLVARAGGLAADVEDVGALVDHPATGRDGRLHRVAGPARAARRRRTNRASR